METSKLHGPMEWFQSHVFLEHLVKFFVPKSVLSIRNHNLWSFKCVVTVGPQAILVVNRDLEDSSSAHTSDLEDAEDVDDAASWETVLSDDELTRIEQEEEAWTDKERPAWDDEVAESQDNGQGNEAVELLADAGGKDLATDERGQVENRPQKYGGPFKLPLVAFGLVSRFAAGWWGQRGSKKGADSAGVARASSSQGRVKHGLEEILDEEISAGSEEQVPQSPKRRVVERVAPCKRDALRMFNDTVLNPVDREDQELDMAASNTATDADSEDRNSSAFADSFTTLEDEQTQSLADVINAVNSSPDGDDFVKAESNSEKIKHFDSVKDPADHHYVGETAQAINISFYYNFKTFIPQRNGIETPFMPTNNRKWVKKIQQEWSILEKNLPDTIYVRVYEDRMDLIRAVIVGAAGTPYHDGLFVFDLYLPPEYPSVPPVAHYHSGGLRLNPNLYENGKVCLSLLNTWTGKGSEIWHPSTSSILQLLVSIQGLVLNAKPYFNEAGYDRQVGTGEGEKNSVVYNENSFLLSCKSMLYLLRRPPRNAWTSLLGEKEKNSIAFPVCHVDRKRLVNLVFSYVYHLVLVVQKSHFEELIGEHFRQRGNRIIQSCKAYLAGAEVGSLIESDLECAAESYSEDKSSAGFKLMLKKLVPKLTAALLEVGASIDAVFMNSINA
ncbi:hypothetical protein AXG93_4259s1070 [Marchantia polymorpha subsp. ruderalis]|uniref:UBC core domain-containing protein n=1 Tax=Marchantia polymorpha subsp. ruderalis TaxID=1480154 RepID=A0A176WTM7_MARPO|nr:hypothetical protein AXG93_4259s1070 [Marchantia polymorpha subsp. ruderalis]